MAVLIGGVVLIAGLLIVTMAVPFILYLKRDLAWMATDRSITSWYKII